MNLTKTEKLRLGTFVLVALVLFVGSILVLAGLRVWERRDAYTVIFAENVSGLEQSAQVKYQGLRVGRVESMRLSPDEVGAVEVVLSLERGTPLFEGTQAVLELGGITGLKTVNLVPGDPRAGRIPPGSRLPPGRSLVDRLTGQAEVIALKVEAVATNLVDWTSDDNRRRVEGALDALTRLLEQVEGLVADSRPSLVAALDEVPASARALAGFADESSQTLKAVRKDLSQSLVALEGTLVEMRRILRAVDSESVRGSVASASAAMRSLETRLSDAELGRSLMMLQDALGGLVKLMGELDLAARASREDFVLSLKHVRQATEDLREFSRIIAQDPSVLVRGRELEP